MSEMIEVTKHDANNYCLVLRALGMEEEGDPVAEIERLKAENAELRKDADRYLWLRNTSQLSASCTGRGVAFPHYATNETQRRELDAAIDSAAKGESHE
jgi:hypothetical protein